MLKKYSSKIETTNKKKKKKKKKAEVSREWVDTSFIKTYTDHDALKLLMEDVETKYHNIAEWYLMLVTLNCFTKPFPAISSATVSMAGNCSA